MNTYVQINGVTPVELLPAGGAKHTYSINTLVLCNEGASEGTLVIFTQIGIKQLVVFLPPLSSVVVPTEGNFRTLSGEPVDVQITSAVSPVHVTVFFTTDVSA